MLTKLKAAVGDKKADGTWSANIPGDVMKVQMPLSTLIEHHRLMVFPPLKLTGQIHPKKDDPTILAIRGYQRHVLELDATDETGRIEQGLEDLQKLNQAATRVSTVLPASPTRAQITNKLKVLSNSDELSYLKAIHDPNGTISCILSKLVNRAALDDSFCSAKSVEDYLKFSGAGAPPPIKTSSLVNKLLGSSLPADDAATFIRLKEAVLDLLDGIIKARQVDVYQRSAKGGVGAAVAKLESWMKSQSNNQNSIYSCCKPQLTGPDGFWGRYVSE